MKKIKVTPTERRILDAIKAAKAKGIKITQGKWSVVWNASTKQFTCKDNCCCPLGAVLLAEQPNFIPFGNDVVEPVEDIDNADLLTLIASQALDKDAAWVNEFVATYDDDSYHDRGVSLTSAQKSGLKVRNLLDV